MTKIVLSRPPQTRPSRAKPADQLKRHVLTEIDPVTRRGVCRKCGPVSLVTRSGRLACEAKGRQGRHEHLLTRYGVTLEEYEQLYAAQEGRCKICRRHRDVLDVDHCHDTGIVRGLLCGDCNRGLGLFKHDETLLRGAIHYLERRS